MVSSSTESTAIVSALGGRTSRSPSRDSDLSAESASRASVVPDLKVGGSEVSNDTNRRKEVFSSSGYGFPLIEELGEMVQSAHLEGWSHWVKLTAAECFAKPNCSDSRR